MGIPAFPQAMGWHIKQCTDVDDNNNNNNNNNSNEYVKIFNPSLIQPHQTIKFLYQRIMYPKLLYHSSSNHKTLNDFKDSVPRVQFGQMFRKHSIKFWQECLDIFKKAGIEGRQVVNWPNNFYTTFPHQSQKLILKFWQEVGPDMQHLERHLIYLLKKHSVMVSIQYELRLKLYRLFRIESLSSDDNAINFWNYGLKHVDWLKFDSNLNVEFSVYWNSLKVKAQNLSETYTIDCIKDSLFLWFTKYHNKKLVHNEISFGDLN